MRIHPSAYLSLLAFAPLAALAEATEQDPATAPVASATKEEHKVSYELEVGTRLFLMDSQNKKTPYFDTSYVPLWGAVNYSHGVARVRIEGEVASENQDSNAFRIRQAYAGVETPFGTEVRGGRFTPEYIKDYNPFVLAGSTGDYLGFLDGFLVGQKIELGGDDKAFVQAFVVNGLPVTGGLEFSTSDTSYVKTPATGSRAFGVAAGADVMGLGLRVTYAMNPKKTIDVTSTNNGTTTQSALAADYSRLGFSLGYSMTGLSLGGFYEGVMIGETKAVKTPYDNGKIDTTGDTLIGKITKSNIGFGLKGTTELFGVTGVIASGDAFTYGVGYEMVSSKYTNVATVDPQASDRDIEGAKSIGISVGYQLGGFSTAIGYKTDMGNKTKGGKKNFKDPDGKDTDTANSVQVAFLYNL